MKKRCGFRFTKRLLSVALAAALVCQLFGLPVLALGVSDTVGSSGCTHVHNETCGYIQAEEGTPCKHTLGVHDDTCGYSVGTEEIPCDMYCRGGGQSRRGLRLPACPGGDALRSHRARRELRLCPCCGGDALQPRA